MLLVRCRVQIRLRTTMKQKVRQNRANRVAQASKLTGPASRIGAMEAFLVSTGVVALAEMGDKTQLLSLVLAARFRKPWPIVLGIFAATVLNHALAGAVGNWVTHFLGAVVLRWILGGSFIAMALWMLIPDKLDDDD